MAERFPLDAARRAPPPLPSPISAAPDDSSPASGEDDELDELGELDEREPLDAPLPEVDGGLEEEEEEVGLGDGEGDEPAQAPEDADPFDDAAAADLDLGPDLDETDESAPAAEDDAETPVDAFGGDDVDAFEDEPAEGEEAGFELDEGDEDEAPRGSEDDGGAEGMGEREDFELDEGDLPAIDAGEGEEGDDLAFADLLEPGLPRPAARPWSPREGAGADVPCHAVAAEGGLVAAAGEAALVALAGELAARELALVGPCVDVAVSAGAVYVARARGGVVVSRDAGLSFSELPGVPGEDGTISLAATPGRLWLLASGGLWRLTEGALATRVRAGVRAIAASGGTLVALVTEGGAASLERVRGDDEAPLISPAAPELGRGARTARLAAAREGRSVAILASGALHVSHDAGGRYRSPDLPPVVAATFVEEAGPGAPDCVALSPDPERGLTRLFAVAPDGDVETVAVLQGFAPGSASLAWDAFRDALWVASASGLVAIERPRRH